MNHKSLSHILFALTILPLLAYPAVLVANAMQAAAYRDPDKPESRARRWAMNGFLLGTTAYPVVLFVARFLANRAAARFDENRELAWSAAPLGWLLLMASVFQLLLKSEGGDS